MKTWKELQKTTGDSSSASAYKHTTNILQASTKLGKQRRKTKYAPVVFCAFCETRGYCAQNCLQITNEKERVEKLKAANRCLLLFNLR
jgi:hypothetical protein